MMGAGLTAARRQVASAMPPGAKGIWYADSYQASPRPYIPNLLSAGKAPANLIAVNRRQFTNQLWWGGNSTITAGATDRNGGNEAARIVGVGAWSFQYFNSVPLPAGTFTMAMFVKSNTGSPQTFKIVFNNREAGEIKTATTSWTRVTHTFTIGTGAAQVPIFASSPDGTTGCDILIDQPELFAGSSDLGPENQQTGHLILGTSAYDPNLSVSGGKVGPACVGSVSLPTATLFPKYTVIAVFSQTAAGTSHQGILGDSTTSNFLASFSAMGGSVLNYFQPLNDGWHMIAHRYNGTNQEMFFDTCRLLTTTVATNPFTLQDIVFGIDTNFSFLNGFSIAAWALYDRDLSNAEMLSAYAALKARIAISGITLPTNPLKILVAEGDSITQRGGNALFQPDSPTFISTVNYAVSGSQLSDVIARNASADGTIIGPVGNNKFIYSLMIGTNGLGVWPGATDTIAVNSFLAAVAAQLDGRRAAGFNKIVVCTITPVSGATTFNARRAIMASIINSSWVGVHCDAIADFANDAIMGVDNSFSLYPDHWSDTTHPNALGFQRLEPIYSAAINSL